MPENEALRQLRACGVTMFLRSFDCTEHAVCGRATKDLLPYLREHAQFQQGLLYGLHTDVGKHLTDFRSFRGAFGKGSLQIVLDKRDGAFYADVDAFSPYADVVGFLGHAGEVIGPKAKWVARKIASPFRKAAVVIRWLKTPESEREG